MLTKFLYTFPKNIYFYIFYIQLIWHFMYDEEFHFHGDMCNLFVITGSLEDD